jgi:hypothetical protein
MITNVTYKPTVRTPGYNPIIWSCQSTKVNEPNFKFVFDIYIDGIKVNRIKQRANPTGYGMLDVSTLVQGYLDPTNNETPLTQGETEINWSTGELFHDNLNLSRHVFVRVGEEYTFNSQLLIWIGTADVPGNPAFNLFSGNTDITTLPVRAWSASITDHEQQWNMQQTTGVGIFSGNPFDSNKNYDHGYGLANPLKFGMAESDAYVFDKMTLSFLNWSPKVADVQNRPIYGFRYNIYNEAGTLVSSADRPLILSNGFGQRVACDSTVTATLLPKYDIVHLLTSPKDLVYAINPALTVLPGWKIEITGHRKTEGNCTFAAPCTVTQTINVIEYCPPLYERVRLSWVNTLGGRDYLNFTMFNEKSIATKQEVYTQEQMNWSGSTPVPLNNNSLVIGNLGVKGGDKSYNKQVETSYKIQTDWLTQEEMYLLESLQKSPQVLAYIHDPNNPISDYYAYTAMVANSSYTVKNIRQNKLYQGSFDIKLVMGQKIQNM